MSLYNGQVDGSKFPDALENPDTKLYLFIFPS